MAGIVIHHLSIAASEPEHCDRGLLCDRGLDQNGTLVEILPPECAGEYLAFTRSQAVNLANSKSRPRN